MMDSKSNNTFEQGAVGFVSVISREMLAEKYLR